MFYILIAIQSATFLIGFIVNTSTPSGDLLVPIKVILSLSFVLAALLVRKFNNTKVYTKYVLVGMVFCFIGDAINLKIVPFFIDTLGSIVFFGLAHLFFILAYTKTVKNYNLQVLCKQFYIGIALFWTITLLLWRFLILPGNNGFMVYGVLAYGLLVSTMSAFSLQLIRVHKKYLLVAAGASMFVISDLFLAITGIGGMKVLFRDAVIWATYILALMGIIYSGHFSAETRQNKTI